MDTKLKIKTVQSDNGSIEYVLIDPVTGEELIRGSWKEINDMKSALITEQLFLNE